LHRGKTQLKHCAGAGLSCSENTVLLEIVEKWGEIAPAAFCSPLAFITNNRGEILEEEGGFLLQW